MPNDTETPQTKETTANSMEVYRPDTEAVRRAFAEFREAVRKDKREGRGVAPEPIPDAVVGAIG